MTASSSSSSGRLWPFALAYAGGVIGYLPLLSLLLPLKVSAAAGDERLSVMTACVVAGAVAASASNIIFGVLSDRSAARGRGRRGWLAGGVAMTAASYAGIAAAASPLALVIAVVAFQVAVNALLAPLLALMADEVPDGRKGLAGGLLALGQPAALGLGALLVGWEELSTTAQLAIVPLAAVVCTAPLLLMRGATVPRAAPARTTIARRDLLLAWGARLLVQVAGAMLAVFVLFYFESIVPVAPVQRLATRVSTLLLAASLLSIPVALLAGRLSDRTGARRPILLAAAMLAALGLGGMSWARSWNAGALAFSVYSIGSAVFLALHAVYAMQLLPGPRHRGRDLGLLNLTNTVPSLAGPLLTWALASPRDFAPVMEVLALLTAAGGAMMLAVRGRG